MLIKIGMGQNVWFFDHYHPENSGEDSEGKSYTNKFEAQVVIGLVKHLVRQGYTPDQIAVLTPYPLLMILVVMRSEK